MGIAIFLFICIIIVIIWYKYIKAIKERDEKRREQEGNSRRGKEFHDENVAAYRKYQLEEARIQAEEAGVECVVVAIANNKYVGKLPHGNYFNAPTSIFDNLMTCDIAGIRYRGNLHAYVGEFRGTIKPERTNDYDPKAIRVQCEDGRLFGYVPEDMTDAVRSFIGAGQDFPPYRITGHIYEYEIDDQRFYGFIRIVKPN